MEKVLKELIWAPFLGAHTVQTVQNTSGCSTALICITYRNNLVHVADER